MHLNAQALPAWLTIVSMALARAHRVVHDSWHWCTDLQRSTVPVQLHEECMAILSRCLLPSAGPWQVLASTSEAWSSEHYR